MNRGLTKRDDIIVGRFDETITNDRVERLIDSYPLNIMNILITEASTVVHHIVSFLAFRKNGTFPDNCSIPSELRYLKRKKENKFG